MNHQASSLARGFFSRLLVRTYPDTERSPPDLVKSINNSNDNFAVSRDGKLLAGILFGGVYLYDAASGALLRQWAAPTITEPPRQPGGPPPPNLSRDGFLAVAISPDSTEVAVCGFSGRIYFLGVNDLQLRHTTVAFDEGRWCTALAYSTDGKLVAAGGRLWTTNYPKQLEPDERKLQNVGAVRVWRVENGSLLASFAGMAGDVRTLAWSHSENELAAGDDGSLWLWRITDEAQPLIFYRRIGEGVVRIAFSARDQLACVEERGFDVVIYR